MKVRQFTRGGALVLLLLVALGANGKSNQAPPTPVDTPPSAMPLQDYETQVLYPWLKARGYARPELGWTVDSGVRDTGPFIAGNYYGTHPAVRIYYSPAVRRWLDGGRSGPVPDGGIIVKEMFTPPAAIYREIAQNPWFEKHPDQYEALLEELLSGWAVLIKDSRGDSKDGWFWSSPGNAETLAKMLDPKAGNVDDYSHVLTSAFGIGTCIRCHASAESENTFSSSTNFLRGASPLQFRVDNSWRTDAYLGTVYTKIQKFLTARGVPEADAQALLSQLNLPQQQRPWRDDNVPDIAEFVSAHLPRAADPSAGLASAPRKAGINADFVANFADLNHLVDHRLSDAEIDNFSFPFQWSDHVVPKPAIEQGGTDNPSEYITSDNCYGCHGGLGGAPFAVTMFVQTGPKSGDGFNISEYGEWRWSPMGLAGRDPVFHAQLETELIILMQENGQLKGGKPATGDVRTAQQALTDTCLRCHGAMGLRQKGIDQGGDILNPRFDVNFFYLTEPLTAAQKDDPDFKPPAHQVNPPSGLDPKAFYAAHDLGELAREGISCLVCHRIAPPDAQIAKRWVADHPAWFGKQPVWSDAFFYFLGRNTTGLYTRNAANELYGPFDDIKLKPMQNALGITPRVAPAMHHDTPFTSDSAMCGTCHTINLPNIGAPAGETPVLTALEPNPHFKHLSHSVEQATYLEWLNSAFGLGKDNKKGDKFQSCQDCHMPNRFATLDKSVEIPRLASQIATIQGAAYPQSEHQLASADLDIKTRPDYRRHELVGLNAFMIEMFKQFPEVLGVSPGDYETGAVTGADFAIENMLLSAREGRVATVTLNSATVGDTELAVDVTIANKTGHRFPSGVTFRRAFLELLVLDEQGRVIWSSGRTNSAGVIVDRHGRPLATEFLNHKASDKDSIAQYQPNHQTIRSDRQVQIYEELITNAANEFTTSFIHRVHHIKDNRLPPEGAVNAKTFAGQTADAGIGDQGQLLFEFMKATEPEGASVIGGTDPNGARFDADTDFTASPNDGADRLRYDIPVSQLNGRPASVRATLYSQSLMPAWFHQRFSLANAAKAAGYNTPETDRLYYLASRLNLEGTAIQDWKLEIDSDRLIIE